MEASLWGTRSALICPGEHCEGFALLVRGLWKITAAFIVPVSDQLGRLHLCIRLRLAFDQGVPLALTCVSFPLPP